MVHRPPPVGPRTDGQHRLAGPEQQRRHGPVDLPRRLGARHRGLRLGRRCRPFAHPGSRDPWARSGAASRPAGLPWNHGGRGALPTSAPTRRHRGSRPRNRRSDHQRVPARSTRRRRGIRVGRTAPRGPHATRSRRLDPRKSHHRRILAALHLPAVLARARRSRAHRRVPGRCRPRPPTGPGARTRQCHEQQRCRPTGRRPGHRVRHRGLRRAESGGSRRRLGCSRHLARPGSRGRGVARARARRRRHRLRRG